MIKNKKVRPDRRSVWQKTKESIQRAKHLRLLEEIDKEEKRKEKSQSKKS